MSTFLAFDARDNLYATYLEGYGSYSIHKFSPTGADLGTIDNSGKPLGFLACDSQGNLYVTDYTNKAIHKYDPTGADLGTFVSTGLDVPDNLAFDSHDNLFVNTGPIRKFDPTGLDLGTIIVGNSPALDFAFDSGGSLYVAKYSSVNSGRIEKYGPDGADLGTFASIGTAGLVYIAFAPVPEPSSGVLISVGSVLGALMLWRTRKTRNV